MLIGNLLKKQGNALFRWRSFLPLVLAPAAFLAAMESGYFERYFGESFENAWDIFAVLVSFLGLGTRALVVGHAPRGTSGRNTREQRADSLNTTGLYSVARNPLYLGNFLILMGFALATKAWWFPILAGIAFALYYERIIIAEEEFLAEKFGEAYRTWAERTPAFFPNPRLWQRPELPFCLRNVLRREYHGFYLIVGVHTAIEIATDIMGEGETLEIFLRDDLPWVWFLILGTLAYVVLRILRKHTRLLHVAGR